MALQKREKILASITGVLLVAFLIVSLATGGGNSAASLNNTIKNLKEELETKKKSIQLGKNSIRQMADWEKRSLPSDRVDARSLYQDWLRELVGKAGFRDVRVDSSEGLSRSDIYTMITFTVNGRATIGQLTRFLFDFYSAGHLHKIRHLSITPIKDSKDLTIALTIEALSMPGADRVDKLSEVPSKRLESADVEDYVEAIVKRKLDEERDPVDGGLFVAYRPPPPPRQPPREQPKPPEPPKFDPTTQTFLNAVVEVDGRRQAWLFIRSSNKTLKLYEGDEFEIGPIRGKVIRIDAARREVELKVRGRIVLLTLGDNLRDRLPYDLPDEEEPEPNESKDLSDEKLEELIDELEQGEGRQPDDQVPDTKVPDTKIPDTKSADDRSDSE